MEDHLAQTAATQHEKDQRDKRDQEVQQQQLQAQNKFLEERIVQQLQYEEELRIAKERAASQTIDVDQLPDGDAEVEEFFNAAQAQVNLVDGPNGSQTQEFARLPLIR